MNKQNYYQQICEDEQKILMDIAVLQEELAAIRVIKKRNTPTGITADTVDLITEPKKVINKPKTATPNKKHKGKKTASEKALAGLNGLGQGTARDIAKKMVELFPAYTEEKAYNDAKHHLSKLFVHGDIAADPISGTRSYLYKSLEKVKAA